jgi:Arc/MetJ-type ribon-helix-helix transcriptional regulator
LPDTEKISFNLSVVDLGQIDLLIDQGFYSNRTDFAVAAVRSLLQTHAASIRQEVSHRSLTMGVVIYSRQHLEKVVASGEQLDIRVVGVLVIDDDVSLDLARAAIRSVSVFGKFRAQPEIRAAFQVGKAAA